MRRRKIEQNEENIFWVTMSDMFLGMFMVFAILFFAFVINTSQDNAEIQEATKSMAYDIVEQMKEVHIKAKIIDENNLENSDNSPADIEIDPISGLVRISDLALFDLNSSQLTPKGKEFLNKFIPVYFDTIYKNGLSGYITSVVIQGHTDTTNFKGNYSKEQQYMKNMNLSVNRAYNVTNFIFEKCSNKQYQKNLLKTIKVEGASSSSPIIIKNVENKAKSRRVEIRLQLKQTKPDIISNFLAKGATYDNLR